MTADSHDLYRALRDALAAHVRATAIKGALDAILTDECSETEAAMILRRLANATKRRRPA